MLWLLVIAIEALLLIGCLKVISGDEVDFGPAAIFASIASIGTYALAYGLAAALSIWGIMLASVVAALLIGVAVSAIYGTEIKRAFAIGAIFAVFDMSVRLGLSLVFLGSSTS